MDLSEQELRDIADGLGVSVADLQSDAVKDCAESVKAERDVDEATAFAICQDMENEGLLQGALVHDLAAVQDPGAIERVEEGDTVRYRDVLLLAPGVWGDAGSGRHVYYSPEGIENSADNWADNTVNLFHERENEVTDVGTVDTDAVFVGADDGGLYGDIVLHMDNPASEFADAALTNALETDGREGLQGPSAELRGDEYRFNDERGVHELVEGTFNGLGLVGLGVSPGPGSKDAAFAEQTRERAVALAGDDDAELLTPHHDMKTEHVLEQLNERGIGVGDDPDDETLRTLAEAFDLKLQDDEDDGEETDENGDEEGDGDGDEDDDPDEDDDMDLAEVAEQVSENAEKIATLSEQLQAVAEATEALQSDEVDLAELSESIDGLQESVADLAAGDRVDDLEQRLAALEDEPEDPASLADVDGADAPTDDDDERILVEMGGQYDPPKRTATHTNNP